MAAVNVAEALPIRLRNFFARYPPQLYSSLAIPKPTPPEEQPSSSDAPTTTTSPTAAPSPYTPSRRGSETKTPNPQFSVTNAILRSHPDHPNPFLPYKNPATGRWRGATVSLRRQNELVRLAGQYGVEQLLPPGRKSTEFREVKVLEKGLRIKGTGVGQKVKGHKWERTMRTRLDERKKAMVEMPEMIRLWKQRGHGRGWKKYPR